MTRLFDGEIFKDEVREKDYEIVRQLYATQAHISIWNLLATFITHHEMLVKALSWIQIDTATSPDGLIHVLIADKVSYIGLFDDDLLPEGVDHTRPFYFTIGCLGHRVLYVLLDNGSTLNVFPLSVVVTLGFVPTDFDPFTQIVQTYDNTRREVMGTFLLGIQVRSVTFSTLF